MTTMTPASQHVSEHILAPLRRIARRHWLLVALRCVLQLVTIGLLVLLAIALILGHLPNLSPFLRLPMVFLTWSGIVALGYFAIRPMFQSWSVDRAALAVEHSLPQVQERISSAVELSNDTELRYRASESLIAHLISQAEEDASNIQPEMVIRPRGLLVWALALAPVLGIWAIAAFARPLTMEAGLFRVFMPWKSELPAFLARISVTPGNQTINQGEPLTITLKISPEAGSVSDAPGQAMLVKRFTSGQVLSQDLDRSDTLQFAATLQNVQQGFTYRVDSAAGQSPWYTVTVRARPAISGIDLSYEYPTYTQIAPKTVSAPDGAIESVVGTKVRLTVHATQPLNERSRLTMDPGMPDAAELPLTLAAPGTTDYQATLMVKDNGTYHFVLVNTDGLEGVADETRTITAHPDQPPTIAIVSPHTPSMSVRNDDTVPIRYKAGDDFGVQKIQALVSVDDREVGPFNLIFDPTDRRNINGQYNLSVAYMLQQANVQGAHRITYQFEAWDNRDPNPQTALTVKQSLLISEQPIRSYEARLAAHDANHLMEAINLAIERLNHADEHVNHLQQADAARPLRAGERETAEQCKTLLTKTATDLTAAADDAFSSEMADVAAKAGDIAAHPITDAAQSIAKAQLDADAGAQRQQDVTASGQQIADARTQLKALLSQVKSTEQRSEAARDLAQAAKDQEKVAQDMAKLAKEQTAKNDQNPQNPQNPQNAQNPQSPQAQQNEQKEEQQLQKDEQKADQDLQQAMNEDPSVKQDSEAQKTADKLAALQKKIDDLHDQQETQSQATAQQKAPDLSKIAAEQKALNDQIKQFEQQQQNNLQQAKATPPPDQQQNQIVSDLNNGQPSPAANNMQKAVDQLNNNAQQLQQASATTQPFTQAQQNKLDQDSQAQDSAKNDQSQAEQAATALNQQTQPPGANDPTVQQAQQAAQAIQQQAKSMTPQANDAADSQTNAEQEAQKAAADAQAAASAQTPADATKDMQQAAQELRHAANDLVQAEQQNAAADKSAIAAQQAQAEQQAAAQAQALAQQQQNLLQQAQPNAQAAKDEAAQQQQIAQANQDAQQLQQMAQADQDDDVTQRASDAQQAIQQATKEAQQATQAEQNNHPDQAAQNEANAAHQLALADNALRGQPPQPPQEAQNDQDPADPHQNMDDQQNQQGQPDPNSQQANAQQPDQQGQQPGQPDMTQQPGQGPPRPSVPHGEQPDQSNQQDQTPAPGQTTPSQHEGTDEQPKPGTDPDEGQGQGQGSHPGSGKPQPGQDQSQSSAQSAEAAHEQADEAADEAANAQSQAQGQGQGQPGQAQQEAQQAANELAKAAQDMQQSAQGSQDSKDSFSSGSGRGKASVVQKSTKPEPAAVQAMGVSSRDWAKLPPLMQQDLLNAAQQNSLPAYRESIKNYFEKIARLKEPGQPQQSTNE